MTKFAVILGFAGALALVGCGGDDNNQTGGNANVSQCKALCTNLYPNVQAQLDACNAQCEAMGNGDGNGNNPPPVTIMDDDAGTDPNPPQTRDCGSLAYPLDTLGAKGVCAAATKDCINACQDSNCLQGCLDSDTGTPATYMGQQLGCDFCISNQQFACLEQNGCDAELNDLACCFQDAQATCASQPADQQQTCVQNACSSKFGAINSCFQAKAGAACGNPSGAAYADCYAAAP